MNYYDTVLGFVKNAGLDSREAAQSVLKHFSSMVNKEEITRKLIDKVKEVRLNELNQRLRKSGTNWEQENRVGGKQK